MMVFVPGLMPRTNLSEDREATIDICFVSFASLERKELETRGLSPADGKLGSVVFFQFYDVLYMFCFRLIIAVFEPQLGLLDYVLRFVWPLFLVALAWCMLSFSAVGY